MKRRLSLRKSWPTRLEILLLSLLSLTVFFMDVSENKVLDKGLDYETTWFGGYHSLAINNFWFGIFIYLILFTLITFIAISSRNSNYKTTAILSMIATFGLGFIMAGFLADYHSVQIPFFTMMLNAIDFYHIGITLVVSIPIILTFTE
jgi:hypothetical protein